MARCGVIREMAQDTPRKLAPLFGWKSGPEVLDANTTRFEYFVTFLYWVHIFCIHLLLHQTDYTLVA